MDGGQLHWAWRNRGPRDFSQSLGKLLGGLAGSSWFKQHKHLGPMVRALEELLPAELSSHLAVDGFHRNTLHLKVDSSAHRYELETVKPALLAALNEQINGVFIRDIRIALGGLEDGPAPRNSTVQAD